jgi:RimJ/RimL family protein N-acetyltransferase
MAKAHVRLRPITEADLPVFVRWFNDPEVTRWLQMEPGVTLDGERQWFAGISSPDSKELIRAIEVDGQHVGNTGLRLHADGFSANFGITIGEKPAWGNGYGTAATREMLRIGFEERGLHRIELQVWPDNLRAQCCYLKCGFRVEGMRRQAVRKGESWIDAIAMAILREEWEDMNQAPADDGKVRIRTFALADYDQVVALWQAAGLRPRPLDARDEIAKKLQRDPDLFLVAHVGPRIVGTVIGGWDGRRATFYRMAVHPDHQRQGIGTSLMREMEKRLLDKGARSIQSNSGKENSSAHAFYQSLGYELRDDEVLLGKTLQPEETTPCA